MMQQHNMDSNVLRAHCQLLLTRIDTMELVAFNFRGHILRHVILLDFMQLRPDNILGHLGIRNAMRTLDRMDAIMGEFVAQLHQQRGIIASFMIPENL